MKQERLAGATEEQLQAAYATWLTNARPSRFNARTSLPRPANFPPHAAPRPRRTFSWHRERPRPDRAEPNPRLLARGLPAAQRARPSNPPPPAARSRDWPAGALLVEPQRRSDSGAVPRVIARWPAAPRRGQTRFRRRQAPAPGKRRTETATAGRCSARLQPAPVDFLRPRRERAMAHPHPPASSALSARGRASGWDAMSHPHWTR